MSRIESLRVIRAARALHPPRRLGVLLALAAALALPVAARADRSVDESRPASPTAAVSVENLAGSVRVEGWGRNEVEVTGTVGDDVESLEVEGSGGRISIEVKIPSGRGGKRDVSSDLVVRVPVGGRVQVETVSASIEVEGVSGVLQLESVSGSIAVGGSPESLEAETVSGAIELEGETGNADAESVSGSVTLKGVHGRVSATSVSGGLEIDAGSVSEGDFESVSGRVSFSGDLAAGGRLDIEAHSGSVELRLPASVSADFRVTTFSGDIQNDFGAEARRTSRYAPGKELEFSTGGGAARVTVESFSGSVKLRKR